MLSRIIEAAPVDSVLTYCRYNLMITDMDEILTPVAKKYGVGTINASALHMGILTKRGAPDWHPAPIEVRQAGKLAVEHCNEYGIDLATAALRFCFDHPYVSSTLVGMSTTAHVEANLKAFHATSDARLQKDLQFLLKPVFNYVWSSGRPENSDLRCLLP